MQETPENGVTPNSEGLKRRDVLLSGSSLVAASTLLGVGLATPSQAQPTPQPTPTLASGSKPNILVIFGDDIGYWNISAYNLGMMGYKTPNLDRIAREGAIFTDCYGQQSCTAGRAAFITGQSPFRTGLTRVGLPGATLGLQKEDPTIAELLKNFGYMTFQHGKNHLGDRNEFLPTVHGFDEFFGNLYHLNAEEEPENVDYPKNPEFRQRFGPRGVLKCKATDVDDSTVDPRFGRVGKQTIIDTGPLTRERMKTVDTEFLDATLGAMDRAKAAGKPFFIWHNTTRMHIWTHLQKKYEDLIANRGLYGAGMAEFDDDVGVLLKKLDDLGIANNTIVVFSSDNGAETFTWPDGGTTPFRSEKGTNWEGGFRVPCLARWPGTIKPGTSVNDIVAHEDWAPTLLAAAGEPNVKGKLLDGYQANGRTFKVHLDGYDLMTLLSGQGPAPRKEFFYFTDDGDLCALRYTKWKAVFLEQEAHGLGVWQKPFASLRVPIIFDLHADPFERANVDSGAYETWFAEHLFLLLPAQAVVGQFLASFRDFPPRQKAATFTVEQAFEALHKGASD
ncbi:MAG: arylsulfatase [Xanthobacteraceae bacterium]